MDFYDYINRYELAFKKKLYAAYKERQAYEKDIKNYCFCDVLYLFKETIFINFVLFLQKL